MLQRYVSKELTHFVGRDTDGATVKEREEERYARLLAILRSRTLLALGDWQGDPDDRPWTRAVRTSVEKDLSEMFADTVVCFCDIPVDDLALHMEKYSQFGLAFSKQWLLAKGANPVLYVAEDSVMRSGNITRKEIYTDGIRETVGLIEELMGNMPEGFQWQKPVGMPRPPSKALGHRAFDLKLFLVQHLFALIKPFKATLSDDDPQNYYMEREWRVAGDVKFELDDVVRIIVPRTFGRRLRDDVPEYFGQVTFPE